MANRQLELGVFAPTIGCMPPAASRLVYGGKVNLRPVISHTVSLREGLRAFLRSSSKERPPKCS